MAAAEARDPDRVVLTGSALSPLEQQIAALVARRAANEPSAIAVWVFGSRARGDSMLESDLDIAVEIDAAESPAHRAWLEQVRREAEEPVAQSWPGMVDLVGLYRDDADPRLARQVRAEGRLIWRRSQLPANGSCAINVLSLRTGGGV
jgi:predicted nucleotidyltransferase